MRLLRFIVIACLFCGFASAGIYAKSTPKQSRQDSTTRRESGRLKKTFGIFLPGSAEVVRVLKTPRTKVTFLLIQMPPADAPTFKKSLGRGPFPKGAMVDVAIEDADCSRRAKASPCTRIGFVNFPSDEPERSSTTGLRSADFVTILSRSSVEVDIESTPRCFLTPNEVCSCSGTERDRPARDNWGVTTLVEGNDSEAMVYIPEPQRIG